jgi:phosphate:Na+ symporter
VGGVTTFPYVMGGIAFFHTAFNIINVLLFLPFVPAFARFLVWLKPDLAQQDVGKLKYLDIRMLETPAIGIDQSQMAVMRMGQRVESMMDDLGEVLRNEVINEDKAKAILMEEEDLDLVQREIVLYLSRLLSGSVPHDLVDRGRMQLRMADEYESISDYIARLLKMQRKLQRTETTLTAEHRAELLQLHGRVADFIRKVNHAVSKSNPNLLGNFGEEADAITETMKDYRDKHLAAFAQEASPLASLMFTDSLTAYRRIRSHTLNVAQALAGEK